MPTEAKPEQQPEQTKPERVFNSFLCARLNLRPDDFAAGVGVLPTGWYDSEENNMRDDNVRDEMVMLTKAELERLFEQAVADGRKLGFQEAMASFPTPAPTMPLSPFPTITPSPFPPPPQFPGLGQIYYD